MASTGETKPDPITEASNAAETTDSSATGHPTTYTEMASSAAGTAASTASAAANTAGSAAVGVKDTMFSMFGGGAKKEKKEDEDENEDRSGSAKAKKDAEAAEEKEEGEGVCVLPSPRFLIPRGHRCYSALWLSWPYRVTMAK